MATTRRQFLSTASAAALAPPPATRPNILFLMPDQHRAQAVGCLGNPEVKTPHLDALARQGLTIPHTFANTPVCCPARAILLTGQYCHRNGMVANDLRLREDGPSLAKALAAAGYRTGFIGKWHLDGGPRLPGFVPPGPRRQGYQYWAANQCSHQHFNNTIFRDTPEPIRLDRFEADAYADYAIEFLRQSQASGEPFYLTVQWGPPHDPYKAPPEYRKQYDPAKLTMRPNWQAKPGVPGPEQMAEYYGMVTAIDDATGKILAALETLGLAENTIVLYSSDHGDMLGSQGERLKRKPWEESIRVPGFLRWPGKIAPGTTTPAFFTHVDFAPTLLGLAGVRVPAAMQGKDLSPDLLRGKGTGPREAFFQIFGPFAGDGTAGGWRGIRTDRYVYARYADRPWVLYDLQQDPYQQNNLIGKRKALEASLDRRLARKMAEVGDEWTYNWTAPVEDAGRLYKHQTFRSVQEYLDWAAAHPEKA
jgi:arylsulfatase A-like enzyme